MGRARSYVIAAAISLASVLLFNANGRYLGTQDTEGTALVPVVLNRDASLRMDEFQAHFERDTWTYFFRETSYGVLPSFPIATGLLLAPFYALPVHWYSARSPDTSQWVRFSRIMAKLFCRRYERGPDKGNCRGIYQPVPLHSAAG